jgi:hypothetical protein
VLGTSLPVRNIFAVLAVCPAAFAVCIYTGRPDPQRTLGLEALVAVAEA